MNPIESIPIPVMTRREISRFERMKVWLKLGIMSFGGLAGQVALFYDVLVKRKQWITEKAFFRAVNYCIVLPGATGHQLATYCGWLTHGIRGGVFAGLLYVLPGALLMLLLSIIYILTQHLFVVQSFFFGVKAAIVVVIGESLVSISKNILKSPLWFVLSGIMFSGLFFFQLSFAHVMIVAVVFGIIFGLAKKIKETYFWPHKPHLEEANVPKLIHVNHTKPRWLDTLKTIAIGLLVWWIPIWALGLVLGGKNLFYSIGVFVSKIAMIAFGGTYPVLTYVAHTVVAHYHWLTAHQMMDGLGMIISMPGPVIIIMQFIAFVAGYQHAGFTYPLCAGVCASVVCFWATFAPCFLWVFLGAPYMEYLNDIDYLRSVFRSISAAVFGVIINLGLWFAMNVLFTKVNCYQYGYLSIQFPDVTTLQFSELLLTIVAAILLFRFKLSVLKTIAITSLTGVLLYYIIR